MGVFGIRLYEEPRYDVIGHLAANIEIRRSFRLLFAYIAGANQASVSEDARIAMTVPVEVRDKARLAMTTPVQTSEAMGTSRMTFFLPAQYSANNAPKPLDPWSRGAS